MTRRILCVLAGGRSSRFGGSKLDVRVDRRPMLTWLLDRLGGWASEPWLSLAPGQEVPGGGGAFARTIVDTTPFEGPLAAMGQVLDLAEPTDHVAFVAADKPLIEPWYLASLDRLVAAQAEAAGAMGVWMSTPRRGCLEPLPVVFHAGRGGSLVRRALASGLRGPYELGRVGRIALHPLGAVGDAKMLLDLNTPEDLAALQKALGRHVTVTVDP